MMEKVQACEDIVGYSFTDAHICWEALQVAGSGIHRSGTRLITQGNKRMAVVGDRAIDLVLSEDWLASGATKGEFFDVSAGISHNFGRVLGQRTTTNCMQRKSARRGIGRGAGCMHPRQSAKSSRNLEIDHGSCCGGCGWSRLHRRWLDGCPNGDAGIRFGLHCSSRNRGNVNLYNPKLVSNATN